MFNTINIINSRDVVSFCGKRLDPREASAVMNREGVQARSLEENLQSSNYIPVLTAVWGERDKQRRLEWLRSHADLHAPLLFELAIAEFVAQPMVDTLASIVVPLIQAATFRAHQDSQCSMDSSVHGNVPMTMRMVYGESLKTAVKKYVPSLDLEALFTERDAQIQAGIEGRLRAIAMRTLQHPETLPDPTWTSHHGIKSFSNSGAPKMARPEQFVEIRQRIAANEVLSKLKPYNQEG